MITKDGERNPNSGKSKAEQASNKGQKKKNTGTGNKGGAPKSIPSASASTPKTTPSSSTSGSLTTPKPTEGSTSNPSSSSSSSSSKKKSLSAAEKSKALSDLMDRATIGSSRTYGLSFQSSANRKISDAESKRKQTLVEQATKNGYLGKEKSDGYGSSGSFARESGGTGTSGSFTRESGGNGTSGSFERKSDGTGSYGSFDGKAKSATPSVLERVGNAMLGGAIQSGGTSLDAVGTMYQAGQGGRDTLYGENLEWYQHQLETEEATLKSMQAENRAKPGTYNLKAIQNQQRIIAEAQKKVDAFSPVKQAQEKSGEAVRNLAADVSNIGAKRTEQAKEGVSTLGQMALDALSSTAQMGVDAAANAVLGTPGSMLPFAFRAFGGGTQEARSEGATLEQQMAFGSAMAAKEIFTEKMFNIAGLQNKAYGKGSVDDYIEKAISGAVDKLAKTETGQRLIGGGLTLLGGAAGEGLEELIGDWMEWQLPRIYKKDPKSAKEVAQDSIYDFLVGALSGTFGSLASPGNILNYQQPGNQTQGQRIVDPTASPLDQAILDTLQGVQTPENVTQVREPTDLDNIIMETQMQLQSGISPEVATNKAKDVKNLLNATKEQISRFIQNAFNKQNQYKFLKISDVSPELAETLRTAGIEVEGYAHALRDNDIRHVDNSHGSKSNDKYKVTAEVMEQAQNIIDNYDNLYRGYDTKGGNPTVVYEKQMGNRTFYVEEVLDDGVLGTKQMVITGEDSKPSFLKKYTKIASVSGDTDVPAQSGSKGVSPPGNHVPDASYNTSYDSNVAQSVDSVNRENVGADASTGAAPAGFDPLSHASNQYGAIPPGENPSRVVDIPASMDGETKVSRFSRTAAEAQITTDEMVGRIEQLVQDGKLSHEVYSNKQAIEDGAKQIEKQYARGKSIEQIRSEFIRDANAGKAGAKFVSQGTTLYADAIAEGDYNAASDILVALTAVETNAGQTVQAARLMKSLTPEGRIFTVQKMVSNLEAQINQRRAANKQIEINVPDALLQTYQNAATADAQEAALQNIYQNVADQIPTSLGEAAQQWRYFSMLANPSTHAKNIMGNVSGAVAKIGKDNLAALMETVFIGNKEGRTKAFLNPLSKSDQNLLNLGWADYDNAVDLYEDSTGKYSNTAGDINDKRRYWKINDPQNALTRGIDKALNIAEKANNLNSKALEVEDMWFSKPMYSVALAGYMKANGLTEITDAARTYAMTEAKKGTYNDLNAVSKWATSLGKGSKLGRFLSSTVYPFKKVPANVMVRTVEYSPLGYLKGAWDLIQMQKGNPDITAAKAIDDFAAATTGTALLGVGAMLAKQGILRATGVGDDKEKEQQKNAFGAKDFSILVGDTYIPIDSLTLAGTGLLTGAQIWEAAQNARNGDEPISFEDFLDALSKITDPVFEQSMLSGMDSILTTIQNSDDAGTGELLTKMGVQIIGNYVGQYVPTVVGRVAASLDKNQRSTYLEPDGAWSPVQSAVQGVQKKIPGLRENMAVTYGNWGVPVEGNGANGFGEAAFKAVTPVYPSKQKTDAVEEEIARLHDVNAEYSNFYTKPPKSIAVDGENIKLTSEEYAKYTETRGQTDYNLRKNMLDSDIYKGLPDNVKSKAMSLSQEYANALGKEAAGVGYESDEKWINGLKGKSDEEIVNAILGRAVESEKYISDEAKNKLGNVQKLYDSLAYAGVSDDLKESAREKAAAYFQDAEKAKFGYELSEEQQKLEGKNQKTLAEYFLDEAVKAKYKDANKDGTNRDELLQAYNDNELNDRTAIAVLSAQEVDAYQKFGKAAGVTPQMMLEASSAHARMHEVKDNDGIVTSSVQNQYDDWLDSRNLTEEQKKALRMGFYGDTVDTYNKLVEDLDLGNITVGEAKQELSPTYQYGWTHNVSSTGVQMRDYISSMATFENAPTAEERDKMGFDSKWEWFCNELNKNTELTKEQKYAIAISTNRSMAESTKKKIANKLGTAYVAPTMQTDGSGASSTAVSSSGVTAVTSTESATSGSGSYASSGTGGGTFSGWSSDAEEKSQAQKAYERFGMAAGATEAMYQEAKAALKNIETVYDMDGNVVRSAEDQFDSWLERRDWTEDQKDAVRAGFYADSVKNLRYLSSELREGNISVAAAKSELSARAQTGWTHSVMDTGAAMADYIDAWAQFKEAPNADERKSQGFGTKWAWFCDYLNQTDMTAEQKYAIAVSVQDYAESTRKKIQKNVGWDGVSSAEQEPQEETYDIRTDDGYREYLSLLLKRKDRYEAKDGSVWSVGENGDVIVRAKDGRQLRARAVLGRNGFDDEPGEGYTVGSKAGQLAYKMMQNGVMKTWDAPDGWTWKLVRGEIIAEKNGTKIPVRMAG
nr:MAG TPA: nuclease [Caudoviricetes sp.]